MAKALVEKSQGDKKLCPFFKTSSGCMHGGNCRFTHSGLTPKDGRCFNCGATGHSANECTRPKKAKVNATKATPPENPDSSSSGQKTKATAKTMKIRIKAAAASFASNRGLVLLDSGASHRVELRKSGETRQANANLEVAVGDELPCLAAVDDRGIPTVYVAKANARRITELLPLGFLVASGADYNWPTGHLPTVTVNGPSGPKVWCCMVENYSPYVAREQADEICSAITPATEVSTSGWQPPRCNRINVAWTDTLLKPKSIKDPDLQVKINDETMLRESWSQKGKPRHAAKDLGGPLEEAVQRGSGALLCLYVLFRRGHGNSGQYHRGCTSLGPET